MQQGLPNLINKCDVNVAWLCTAEFWSPLNLATLRHVNLLRMELDATSKTGIK